MERISFQSQKDTRSNLRFKVARVVLAGSLAFAGVVDALNVRFEPSGYIQAGEVHGQLTAGMRIGQKFPNWLGGSLGVSYYSSKLGSRYDGFSTYVGLGFPGQNTDFVSQCSTVPGEDNSLCR